MATIEARETCSGKLHYRARVRVRGYPNQTATFHKKQHALAWVAQVEGDMRYGRYHSDVGAHEHTAGEMIDRYIRDVLPVKSQKPRYIAGQKAQLLWWKKRIGEYRLIRVTPYLMAECRDELRTRKRGTATVNRYLAAINHVFNTASSQWGWLQKNPLSSVQKFPEPRGRVRCLSKAEIAVLLAACRQSKSKALYDVVVLALSTGARKDEMLSIEPCHVDIGAGRIVLEETKNNERRQLPISGKALDIVTHRMNTRWPGQHYLFCGRERQAKARIDDAFRAACKKAQIDDFHFHDLRHTFASHLAMNGASLAEIAEALGHKTLNMVKRYAHLSESHTSKVIADMNAKLLPI